MHKTDIDSTKQKWMVEMLEAYMELPHQAPTDAEKHINRFSYEKLRDSSFIAEVVYPTSGDEFLSIKLMDVISSDYDANAEAVLVTAKRIATLERRGSDFKVYHDTDIRTGSVTIDLKLHDLRPVTIKDADLMMKMFHKIDNAVQTGISWIL